MNPEQPPKKKELTEQEEDALLQIFMEGFALMPSEMKKSLAENMGLDKLAPEVFGEGAKEHQLCPRCGKFYSSKVALQSREDSKIDICSNCGNAEALEAAAFTIGKIGFDSPPPKFRGWALPPY